MKTTHLIALTATIVACTAATASARPAVEPPGSQASKPTASTPASIAAHREQISNEQWQRSQAQPAPAPLTDRTASDDGLPLALVSEVLERLAQAHRRAVRDVGNDRRDAPERRPARQAPPAIGRVVERPVMDVGVDHPGQDDLVPYVDRPRGQTGPTRLLSVEERRHLLALDRDPGRHHPVADYDPLADHHQVVGRRPTPGRARLAHRRPATGAPNVSASALMWAGSTPQQPPTI